MQPGPGPSRMNLAKFSDKAPLTDLVSSESTFLLTKKIAENIS